MFMVRRWREFRGLSGVSGERYADWSDVWFKSLAAQIFTDTGMTLFGSAGAFVYGLVTQGDTLSGSRRQNGK
jgi:hypothetical protein